MDAARIKWLINALKVSAPPSRELDADVATALGWECRIDKGTPHTTWPWRRGDMSWSIGSDYPPAYTDDVNLCLKEVPEGLWYMIGTGRCKPEEPLYGAILYSHADMPPYDTIEVGAGEHPTSQAMALLIALLDHKLRQLALARDGAE